MELLMQTRNKKKKELWFSKIQIENPILKLWDWLLVNFKPLILAICFTWVIVMVKVS